MHVDADGTSNVLCNESVATRKGEQLRLQSPPPLAALPSQLVALFEEYET
jgi:hypothetical protein